MKLEYVKIMTSKEAGEPYPYLVLKVVNVKGKEVASMSGYFPENLAKNICKAANE